MIATVGPYELGEFVAKGGMGEVYRAKHRVTGATAAVKVVRRSVRWSPEVKADFLREVRASASLDHPSIIPVYDFGEVTHTEALIGGDRLTEGSPWFAMELATLGSLEKSKAVKSWRVIRRILVDILDALAHAHARELVHRDLKPANILVTEREDGIALLLADFGIAHATGNDQYESRNTADVYAPSAGTPSYMSPEQIESAWRDMGPWTDLYSLGCVAWEMLTGAAPFTGKSAIDVVMRHITDDPPPFEPQCDVPPGLEGWLLRLLEKHPHQRFQRAADALRALPPAFDEGVDGSLPDIGEVPLAHLGEGHAPTLTMTEVDVTQPIDSRSLREIRKSDSAWFPAVRVVSVPDWRMAVPTTPARRPGLGLFALREIQLVDRESERDSLWRQLADSVAEQATRVAVVRSTSGRGKSTMLGWIATRAHELGVVSVMRTHHGKLGGRHQGLAHMVGSYLGTGGLDRAKVFARLARRFSRLPKVDDPESLAAAVTQLTKPAGPETNDTVPAVQFGSPTERYDTIRKVLVAESSVRPLLITMDDAQWGGDTLAFVEYLLEVDARSPAPICVVLAVGDDVLDERTLEHRRLGSIIEHPPCSEVELGPMPRGAHIRLVDELLGLDADLAAELVDASGGDPMYSVSVVGDWIQRDAMVPGPTGYRFPAGEDFELPETAVEVCEARFDRLCARYALPVRCREILQVAAALGEHVDEEEWREVCRRRGLRPHSSLVDALVDAGLATEEESGFHFPHRVLTAALRDAAIRSGRWKSIHSDCGDAIRDSAFDGSTAAERRAQHFIEAGRTSDALIRLAEAVEARIDTSAYEEAIGLAELFIEHSRSEQALVPVDRIVRVLAMRAESCRFVGRIDDASRFANELLAFGKQHDSLLARAEALRVLGGLQHRLGDSERGIATYSQAAETYRQIADARGQAKCAHGRGWLNLNLGRFREGRDDFHVGNALSAMSPRDHAWSLQGLAEAHLYLGEVDEAAAAADKALEEFREIGSRSGEGMALTSVANVHRARSEVDQARAHYRSAINLLASFDSALVAFPLVHSLWLEIDHGTIESVSNALNLVTPRVRRRLPPPFRIAHDLADIYVLAANRRDVTEAIQQFEKLAPDDSRGAHPLVPVLLKRVVGVLAPTNRAAADRLHAAMLPTLTKMADSSLSPAGETR